MKLIIFDFNRTLFDPDKNKLEEGAIPILKKLSKSNKLVLITTESEKRGELVRELGIEDFFERIIFTKEKSKECFLNCCLELRFTPEQTIVVGDRIKGEIFIGNLLGMFTIHFKKGKFSNESVDNDLEMPDVVIENLNQLSQYAKLGEKL
jgi:FMN phosphatase YigB (HAD superfamily)